MKEPQTFPDNQILQAIPTYIQKCMFLGISLLCLLVSFNAQAGFREAIEALQEQDAPALLNEVREAVEKKNDDGLMLFLHAMNLDESTSGKLSTLDTILSPAEHKELAKLLITATSNSTVDAQYFLRAYSPLRRYLHEGDMESSEIAELARKGSEAAISSLPNSSDRLISLAKTGEPEAQLMLGLHYLNFSAYGYPICTEITTEELCGSINEEKGFNWLKQAALSFDQSAYAPMGLYADVMCDLFRNYFGDDKEKLEQAYLWCLLGENTGGYSSYRLLGKINEQGNLQKVAPRLATAISNREDISKISELAPLPDWITEARKNASPDSSPVFDMYFEDYIPYELTVYADGKVWVNFDAKHKLFLKSNRALLMQVSLRTLQRFLLDLRQIDFYTWPPLTSRNYFCDMDCDDSATKMVVIVRDEKGKTRRVTLKGPREKELTPNEVNQRTAKIRAVVEKYFPTDKLRYELGNSSALQQFYQQREQQWNLLAKKG